jgi:hypothetical protein
VNDLGQIFSDVTLGTFYLTLRDVPLDPKKYNQAEYYEKIKGTNLSGKCFLVPRSSGFNYKKNKEFVKCYSPAEYSVIVNVNESGNDKFVTKLMMDNSEEIIKNVSDKASELKNKVMKK